MKQFWKTTLLVCLLLLPAKTVMAQEDTTLTLPAGLETIEEEAFCGVVSADKAVIPEGTVSVGARAFAESGFSEIRLPSTVTEIGAGAFRNCGKASMPLRYYCIPSGVNVSAEAFSGCRAALYINGQAIPYFNYTVQNDSVTITGLSGYAAISEAVIPGTIDGKPVTAIANGVFNGRNTMTRVTIPDTVVSIGNDAFRGCSSLTEVDLPAALTTIGSSAFRSCGALTRADLPAGVTAIGNNAFRDCGALTEMVIPSGVTEIAQDTFSGDRNLLRVVLPEGLTTIGETAFYDCYALADMNIPSTVTEISKKAFCYNWALTQVTVPAGITDLANEVFFGCSSLESVTLPDGLLSIGEYTFGSCTKLTDINFPSGLTTLGKSAFENACKNQPGYPVYRLPESLETVGESTFYSCGAALCVARNGNVESLLLENGNTLTYYDRLDYRYQYKKVNDVYTLYLTGYAGAGGNVSIPAGPTVIGENAFKGNTLLTGVTIPDGVTKIDWSAFEDCSELTSAVMSDSVLTIENKSFKNCAKLTDVTFSANLTVIRADAFYGACTVEGTHIYELPDGLTECTSYVFQKGFNGVLCVTRGSVSETTIQNADYIYTYYGETDFRYRQGYFNNIKELGLYDYAGSAASVRLPDDCSNVWSNQLRDKVSSGLELVCGQLSETAAGLSRAEINFTFPGHEGLRYRIINGVLYIMGYTGTGSQIIIPQAADYIQAGWDEQIRQTAFSGKETITKVTVPEGVTRINDDAFNGCINLTDITLPESLKSMGTKVFRYCGQNLNTPFILTLPDHMEDIYGGSGGGANVFEDLNAVLKCGKTSQTAAVLSDHGFVYTVSGEEDYLYRYVSYTEGEETGRRLWLVGYRGEDATANIPAGIYGIDWFNKGTNPWPVADAYGFRDNVTVTKVVIPEGTEVIRDSAFRGCLNLTDITFPSTLRVMENHAFEQCGKNADFLHYYCLPDNMEEISTNTAAGWGAFTDINMGRVACSPDTSTALQLSGIDTYNHNGSYRFALKGHETDGLLYHYRTYATDEGSENRLILEQYEGTGSAVTIPVDCGIYAIGNSVFAGKTNLEKVIIPDGIVQIGTSAFDGCTMLHDGAQTNAIVLPGTVKSIGNLAFKDLGAAYTAERFYLVLPYGLEEFDLNIFTGCNAVLVAPEGSYVAGRLYAGWYRYYNTLEDARAQRNMQVKIPEEGQTVTYNGRP